MRETFVVIGGSHAGVSAIQTLRGEGYDDSIVLVGEEPHFPYERPPLSKAVLASGQSIDDILTMPASWYAENDIETRLGRRAVEIRPRSGVVVLDDDEQLQADGVVIATGSVPRRLPLPDHERIRYLRTYEDAQAVRHWLRPGNRVVIIGAGFIGAEVAAAARTRDVDTVMLEALDVPFGGVLGEEVGKVVAAIHRDHGVDLRTGELVVGVEPSSERVVVTTSTGAVIDADVVVVGIGCSPNDGLARGSGIDVDGGVLVDAHCATSIDRVYAAGDVVNQAHPLFDHRVRVEHYDSAIKQGAVAARNLLGKEAVHRAPPWFWSDQYEHNIQYAGHATSFDQVIIRGTPDSLAFSAFFIHDSRLVGCFGLNRAADVRLGLRMVGASVDTVTAQLGDEQSDLRALVRSIQHS